MPKFTDSYKNTIVEFIINAAIWFTQTTEMLSMLSVDFHGRISVPPDPNGENPFNQLLHLDDQIQRYQRIGQRIDKRFQELMASYCESFNGGETSGELFFEDHAFDFWFEDGKFNMVMKQPSKIVKMKK